MAESLVPEDEVGTKVEIAGLRGCELPQTHM